MITRIQRHLEAIYQVEGPDVRDYLVDEATAANLAPAGRSAREWVFVREGWDW